MYRSAGDPTMSLNSKKFILIIIQLFLLQIISDYKQNHIYAYGRDMTPDEITASEGTLSTLILLFQIFMWTEILLMIIGATLMAPAMTFLQCFLHLIGCLFSIYYIFDAWHYERLWYIWGFFALFPLALDVWILCYTLRYGVDIQKNFKNDAYFGVDGVKK